MGKWGTHASWTKSQGTWALTPPCHVASPAHLGSLYLCPPTRTHIPAHSSREPTTCQARFSTVHTQHRTASPGTRWGLRSHGRHDGSLERSSDLLTVPQPGTNARATPLGPFLPKQLLAAPVLRFQVWHNMSIRTAKMVSSNFYIVKNCLYSCRLFFSKCPECKHVIYG